MHAAALLIAAASLSVDYGWRKADDGRLEYIIQVSPEQLANLKELPIASEIHPQAREAQRFVIQVGKGPLPREGGAAAEAKKPADDSEDKPIIRGQSTGDPYWSPASGTRYSDDRNEAPRVDSRVSVPSYARQPVSVAQQPAARAPAFGAPTRAPVEYSAPTEYDPRPARDVWRGGASPTLEPPASSAPGRIDADLVVAERVGSGSSSPRQLPFSASHSHASHNEEVESRIPARGARDWDEEDEDRESSKGAANPWTVTMMLLFASVGGNVWLGYLVWDLTQRFRDVVNDNRRRRRVADAVESASV